MIHTPKSRNPAPDQGDVTDRETISEYLHRYPDMSDEELTDLIRRFRQLSNVEIALMLSDPVVAPQLERFRAEHKRDTRAPFREYGVLLLLGILGFLFVILAIFWAF